MTGGQVDFALDINRSAHDGIIKNEIRRLSEKRSKLTVHLASEEELLAHKEKLSKINLDSNGECVWLKEKD
jgi:hypothetical protein